MEVISSLPIFEPRQQGDLLKDSTDQHSNLNLKCTFFLQKQSQIKTDARFDVKLDPAVLEAQMSLGTTEARRADPNNACNNVNDTSQSDIAPSAQSNVEFKAILSMQRAALQSLSSQQFDLLLRYVDTLRKQRVSAQKQLECRFCKRNGESFEWFSTHSLKDSKGRVRCPILRSFFCRRCGATGDNAHTIKYCPGTYRS